MLSIITVQNLAFFICMLSRSVFVNFTLSKVALLNVACFSTQFVILTFTSVLKPKKTCSQLVSVMSTESSFDLYKLAFVRSDFIICVFSSLALLSKAPFSIDLFISQSKNLVLLKL